MSGNFTYNSTPRFMITTGIEPDGQTQIVEVRIDFVHGKIAWTILSGFVSGYLGNGVKTVYQAEPFRRKSYGYFRCLDSDIGSASTEVVRTFTLLALPLKSSPLM